MDILTFISELGVPAGWAVVLVSWFIFWRFVVQLRQDDRETIQNVVSALTQASSAMERSTQSTERQTEALNQLRVFIEAKLR
jgi:hypothetical protein